MTAPRPALRTGLRPSTRSTNMILSNIIAFTILVGSFIFLLLIIVGALP